MKTVAVLLIFDGALLAASDEEGRALITRSCTKCHTLTSTFRQRNARERWETIVDEMVAKGAEASDEEIQIIVDYLARHYGSRISVNLASADELNTAAGLSKSVAAAIVAHREKNGRFQKWEDLQKVEGIDWKDLQDKRNRLTLE